ncbi:MAG: hypothetical protein AVDCRST_MAG24-467, partial [uncultured Nocardioidaceae bacterium]
EQHRIEQRGFEQRARGPGPGPEGHRRPAPQPDGRWSRPGQRAGRAHRQPGHRGAVDDAGVADRGRRPRL